MQQRINKGNNEVIGVTNLQWFINPSNYIEYNLSNLISFAFIMSFNKREHVGLPMLFNKISQKKITIGLIAFKKTRIYIIRKPKPILKGEKTQCEFGF
jgi:hypothetical protein